jgi:hypothetical protein
MTEAIASPEEAHMFDLLLFEAELPKENLPKFIADSDLSEAEFQTTDLSRTMNMWSVSSAGQLFIHESDSSFVKDEKHPLGGYFKETPKGIKRVEETKCVHFYKVFEAKDQDYWVSFDALFRKGNLMSVDLGEVTKVPREERLEAQKRAQEIAEEMRQNVYRKTNILIRPIKFLMGLFLLSLHFVGSRISKLHSKL